MALSEERAQQLYEHVAALESQYSEIVRRESALANAHRDAHAAATTLRAADGGSAIDAFIPVGSGVFFGVRVENPDRVIIDIGAGVALSKTRAAALDLVEGNIKELEVALGHAAENKKQIAGQMQQGRMELERIAHSAVADAGRNV